MVVTNHNLRSVGTLVLLALLPLASSDGQSSGLAFEVASIKPMSAPPALAGITLLPDGVTIQYYSLKRCLAWAYDVQDYQLAGPSWMDSERYAITAKAQGRASEAQVRTMLQSLLTERFHLQIVREKKEAPVYGLVVGKAGPKMRSSSPRSSSEIGLRPTAAGIVMAKSVPMAHLARFLNMGLSRLDRPVVDMTGLAGTYDFELRFSLGFGPRKPEFDSGDPVVFDTIQQQLGLRLVPTRAPIDYIIVTGGQRVPSEN